MCVFLVSLFTAYEKGHQRPALSVYTFQMPESCHSQPCSPSGVSSCGDTTPVVSPQAVYASSVMDGISTTTCSQYARPPLPQRGSSLERPHIPGKITNMNCNGGARESFHNSGEFASERTNRIWKRFLCLGVVSTVKAPLVRVLMYQNLNWRVNNSHLPRM